MHKSHSLPSLSFPSSLQASTLSLQHTEHASSQAKQRHIRDKCLDHCYSFTIASVLTAAILTFDIVTDWLAWRSLASMNLGKLAGDAPQPLGHFLNSISGTFLAFCLLSTLVFMVEITRLTFMFYKKRVKFKLRLDGLPNKGHLVERFGCEVTLFIQVVVEDLPLSSLLLALQAASGCQVYIPLESKTFLITVIATCTSIIWKTILVIWHGGCLGQRYSHERGLLPNILRLTTLFLLLLSLCVVTLNFIHIRPPQYGLESAVMRTPFFDDIGIDAWSRDSYVTFLVQKKTNLNYTGNSSSRTVFTTHSNIIRLKKILSSSDPVKVNMSCDAGLDAYWLRTFMPASHQALLLNPALKAKCSAVFIFLFVPSQQSIYFNYAHRIYNEAGLCVSGPFNMMWPVDCADDMDHVFQSSSLPERPSTPPANDVQDVSTDPYFTTSVSMQQQQQRAASLSADRREGWSFCEMQHSIGLAEHVASAVSWTACSFQFLHNESLPLPMC